MIVLVIIGVVVVVGFAAWLADNIDDVVGNLLR
jgi:hypothetical protein